MLGTLEANITLPNIPRLDYGDEELRLRMPTTIHEKFSGQVSDEITRQLKVIAEGEGEAARFARCVSSVRSGRIILREFDDDDPILLKSGRPFIQREPDDQFQHSDAAYPGVVCEMAYSQNGRDLDKAAWTYIPYSNGDIKAVVGFELGYGDDKEAKLSLWQPRYASDDHDDVEILDVKTVVNHVVSDCSLTRATLTPAAVPSSKRCCC